jgi:predicted metal-dependent RNase
MLAVVEQFGESMTHAGLVRVVSLGSCRGVGRSCFVERSSGGVCGR